MLRIQPAVGIELERVLVAIHGDLSGMIERSLATPNPITAEWHYMRKTNHPPREGAILIELQDAVPSAENLDYYIPELRAYFERRVVLDAATRLKLLAEDPLVEPAGVLADTTATLATSSASNPSRSSRSTKCWWPSAPKRPD